MLAELSIRSFAIFHRAQVRFSRGLNVLTGETGAGKSLIVDAVAGLIGERMGPDWVRAGDERALMEGIFLPHNGARDPDQRDRPDTLRGYEAVRRLLEEAGLPTEDECIILSREISRQGARSVGRVNGRAVPGSFLQDLGLHLVDIHSQGKSASLLRVREHLEYLDRYGGNLALRQELAELVAELEGVRAETRALLEDQRRAAREEELLRHEVAAIEAADLKVEEEATVRAELARQRNLARLRDLALEAYQALEGSEHGDPSAGDLLARAVASVAEICRIDPPVAEEMQGLQEAVAAAREAARTLRRYLEGLEEDPARLQSLELRLQTIDELKRKYGDTVAEVLRYRESALARLEGITHGGERVENLRKRQADLRDRIASVAGALAVRRREAARSLVPLVEEQLVALGMPWGKFEVQFQHKAFDEEGVALNAEHAEAAGLSPVPLAFDSSGVDRVEFVLSTNPGEPPKPLARVASGGELSRIMLALKAILSGADDIPILIFDEVEEGVGGRSGQIIGERLWQISNHHQVLCVTHLAGIAAYADSHFQVRKEVGDGQANPDIILLEGEERVKELAVMLAGPDGGDATLESAREILRRAQEWKGAAQAFERSSA